MRPRSAHADTRGGPGAMIAKFETFSPLSEVERDVLARLCWGSRRVEAHGELVGEMTAVPVILEGWAGRYAIMRNGSRHVSALLLPGDADMLSGADHGVAAITPVRVAYLDPAALDLLARDHPGIDLATRRSTLTDSAILRTWLIGLSGRPAIGRVAHLICELQDRLRRVGLGGQHAFPFPLTQTELGEVTGQTPVHANRVVRQLREQGLASLGHGIATVLDRPTLERVAEYDPTYLGFGIPPTRH